MKKIALIFPGIGYHSDKPLLYYGKKLAKEYGYEIKEVSYTGFPRDIKGNPEKMIEAFVHALSQVEEQLKDFEINSDDLVLIISKSIGTAVAAAYQQKAGIMARNIYLTPVNESFRFIRRESGIVFHGTGDDWADSALLVKHCEEGNLPYFLVDSANHSLEVGRALDDLSILQDVIGKCGEYIANICE